MRKYQQQQILKLANTLNEAHAEIKRLHSRGDKASVIQLLADCQAFAMQIGDYIEQIEGEGTRTVSCLEEYCRLLYQSSVEINNADIKNNFLKKLQKQLVKVDNNIRDELKPDKIEIIFLSYKASLWDSLESIWLAAKDDPQCDAYVIPIPYYNRIATGEFGQINYEADQYPDYVPVVDWRSYDIEKRHPDIIFTHNPYDDGNYVTSVHPDFYNVRIKEFTDMLVYIPYFTNLKDVQEHFCTAAGCIYAHRIMLQSENIRQKYIRGFKSFELEYKCKNQFGKPEDKFLALGSPKLDKVLKTKREDCELPDEWIRLIERADGTRKKVILYNTSVGAILKFNEQYLKKLQYVLNIFRNRDDIVLWWRPHPLSEATYDSMRPHLAQAYRDIVSDYCREGYGIYDNTSDLHRSIAVSDAYCGDGSSLVSMYQLTGKPLMVQNVLQLDAKPLLDFFCIYSCEKFKLLIEPTTDSLFVMNDGSHQAKYVRSFLSKVTSWGRMLSYYECVRVDDRLYFIPSKGDEVLYCDLVDGMFDGNDFKSIAITPTNRFGGKFSGAVHYKGGLFLIPISYPAVVRIDLDTHKVEYFNGITDSIIPNVHGQCFGNQFCTHENLVYFVALHSNVVVDFDMDTYESARHQIAGIKNGFYRICFGGNDLWIQSKEVGLPILQWNPENGLLNKISSYPEGFVAGISPFCGMFYESGTVLLVPFSANKAIKIDCESGEMSIWSEFQKECEIPDNRNYLLGRNYMNSKQIDGKIYACALKSEIIVEYDPRTNEKQEAPITLTDHDTGIIKKIKESTLKDFEYAYSFDSISRFHENDNLTLNIFLDYVSASEYGECFKCLQDWMEQYKENSNMPAGIDGNAGKMIYEHCRNELIK